MLTAISRYGARVVPNTEELVAACKVRGEFIQGARIAEFEDAFARRAGGGIAVTAAYGRMAFYYMLKALDLPRGSEIIFPSLTFWVVPELAKVAGLTVVFADVDPKTFTIDAASVERVITEKTRVIVPTHLYGLSCDMDKVEAVAARHNLVVIEDCAHALGATFKGRAVGTFGSGALFRFQTLDPLPESYIERFPNVQATIGLEALKHLDEWTSRARAHAESMNRVLSATPGVQVPVVPSGCSHVYYQYCVYGPERVDRDELVVRCVRRGVHIETLHVDVPPDVEL